MGGTRIIIKIYFNRYEVVLRVLACSVGFHQNLKNILLNTNRKFAFLEALLSLYLHTSSITGYQRSKKAQEIDIDKVVELTAMYSVVAYHFDQYLTPLFKMNYSQALDII